MILETLLCLAAVPTLVTFEGEVPPKPDDNRWFAGDLERALVTAEREAKPVLLYFWVPGSGNCTAMYEETIKADAAVERMRDYLLVSVDSSRADLYPLFERYRITTVPAVRVLDLGGAAIDGLTGYVQREKYVGELSRILTGAGSLPDLVRRVAEAPEDLKLRNSLAGKYQDLGFQDEHDAIQAEIKALDPEGRSDVAAMLILSDVLKECRKGATSPDEVRIERLAEHIETMQPNDVVFSAWSNLASCHGARADFGAQLDALARAWEVVPEVHVLNWGNETALWLWVNRDELDKRHKALALDMATRAGERAELLANPEGDGHGNRFAGDDFDGFLAGRLSTLARAQYMNGAKSEAVATMRRVSALDSATEEHARRLALYEANEDDRSLAVYNDTNPVWSPDGKKLLFVTDRHSVEGLSNDELYVVTVANGKETRLTRTRSNENGACWGPKGKSIAFTSDRFLTNGIYTAKPDGSRQTLLTRFDPDAPTGSGSPCYSPDGKRIAFETYVNGKSEIAVMSAKGDELAILTADTPKTDMAPVWSPDGKSILYMSNRAGDADVYRIGADGSGDRNITNAPKDSWDMDGELSPKGDALVFASWRSGTLEIYTCAPDGSDVVCITNSPETQDRHPRWSPNGRKIAFDRGLPDGSTRIFVMNADGSSPEPVTGVRE